MPDPPTLHSTAQESATSERGQPNLQRYKARTPQISGDGRSSATCKDRVLISECKDDSEQRQRERERRGANQMYSAMILSVQSLRSRLTRSVRLAITPAEGEKNKRESEASQVSQWMIRSREPERVIYRAKLLSATKTEGGDGRRAGRASFSFRDKMRFLFQFPP